MYSSSILRTPVSKSDLLLILNETHAFNIAHFSRKPAKPAIEFSMKPGIHSKMDRETRAVLNIVYGDIIYYA
jgi:hypothetical protein